MEWISVKDRLPEVNELVIGYDGYSVQPVIKCRKKSEWDYVNSGSQVNVTHWMPLPSPPKT